MDEDKNEYSTALQQLQALFSSFFANSFDYLKIFIPLLLLYKTYLKYHHKDYEQSKES
jgi:hypothetical protein